MSEGAAAGFDPRFDPRFQRGYDEDTETNAAVTAVAAVPASPGVAPVQFVAAERFVEFLRRRSTDAAAPSSSNNPHDSDETFTRETATDVDPDPYPEPDPEPATEFEPYAESISGRWFLCAWTVAILAVAFGVGMLWTAISGEMFYGGPSNASDRWLQTASWTVSPALIEGGMLGIVAMLVWTGVRHGRPRRAKSEHDA